MQHARLEEYVNRASSAASRPNSVDMASAAIPWLTNARSASHIKAPTEKSNEDVVNTSSDGFDALFRKKKGRIRV